MSWINEFAVTQGRVDFNLHRKVSFAVDEFAKVLTSSQPPRLSREGAVLRHSREMVRRQLESGEHLVKLAVGKIPPSLGATGVKKMFLGLSSPWYCFALTTSSLLLIGLDSLWRPNLVKRLPITAITDASYTPKWLTGQLRLELGDDQPLILEVVRSFDREAKAIASVFGKKPI